MTAFSASTHAPFTYGERPVLGLLIGRTPPNLRDLLVALYPRCDPRYVDGPAHYGEAGPVAYLIAAYRQPVDPTNPFAFWLMSPDDAGSPLAASAQLLLTHDPTLADAAARPVEVVPWAAQPSGTPVTPAVRARLRTARRLPPAPIAAYESGGWWWRANGTAAAGDPTDPELADTMCAVAAAVIATSPTEAVRALSWAAPTVLDPQTAEAISATDGFDCVVASTGDARLAAAHNLARDDRLAAVLSQRGRELVTSRHDLAALARRVGDRLGLPLPGDGPQALVDAALDELDTPYGALIRTRAIAAMTGYRHSPRTVDSLET